MGGRSGIRSGRMRGGGWVAVQKKGGEAARPGAAAYLGEGFLWRPTNSIYFALVFSLLYRNNNRDAISGNGVPAHMQLVSRSDAKSELCNPQRASITDSNQTSGANEYVV